MDRFADRLRAAPQSRLQRGAAGEALELAREMAVWAQRVEEPGTAPRTMPDAGMFAAADQITVAARDLSLVLDTPEDLSAAVTLVEEAQRRAGV